MAVLTANEQKFETLIEGIVNWGYGLCDHFISTDFAEELSRQLLSKFEADKFSKASVGKGAAQRQHLEIRSDSILWIENDSLDPLERKYLDFVGEFMEYMNRTCFTALKDFELHYACYPQGSFYRKHVDSFVNDKSRQYSLIVYLNFNWTDADGGHLRLYLEDKTVDILPLSGRAICFPSHLIPHEVSSSNKNRLSLTGWLKK
jgi:SM-20-related protein